MVAGGYQAPGIIKDLKDGENVLGQYQRKLGATNIKDQTASLKKASKGRCAICEFISWIEMPDKEMRFLTSDMIFKTRRGKELQKHDPNRGNWTGHGAIMFYFGMDKRKGAQRECNDFSTPENFPKEIVTAIKAGKMTGFDCPDALLSGPAWAEYEKIQGPALAEYKKIQGAALAEYKKIKGAALAEYKKIKGAAWAEYEKIGGAALAEYKKIKGAAWAEYEKIGGAALAEYKKIEGAAWAEYEKIQGAAFWTLFALPENRNPLWI